MLRSDTLSPKYFKHHPVNLSSSIVSFSAFTRRYGASIVRKLTAFIMNHQQFTAVILFLCIICAFIYFPSIHTTSRPDSPSNQSLTESLPKKQTDYVSFLVVGDWGVNPKNRPIDHQIKVANAMKVVHQELSTDFVISVGDHFYDHGVLSDKDPRWKTGFEDIYHPSLAPWYVVFGNHDIRGSIKAQMEYANFAFPRAGGKSRWIAPSNYYSQDFNLPNSNSLMCCHEQYDDLDELEKHECNEMWYKSPQLIPQRFGEDITLENAKAIHRFNFMKDRSAQISWLQHQIDDADSNVSVKFVLVVGHHALWSQGPHSVPKVLNKQIQPVLRSSNKIIGWFCGHNHALEHYVWNRAHHAKQSGTTTQEQLTEMHQFLSGSGGREVHDMSDPPVETLVDDVKLGYLGKEFGFISVKVSGGESEKEGKGEIVEVIYWNEDNTLLHSVEIPFPEYPF